MKEQDEVFWRRSLSFDGYRKSVIAEIIYLKNEERLIRFEKDDKYYSTANIELAVVKEMTDRVYYE